MIVAIDGPAGSGKSTTARFVAEKLGYKYIDSGATYRALAIAVKRDKIDPNNKSEVERLSANLNINFRGGKIFLDGDDITNAIRDEEIGKLASLCSTYKGVRENMVKLQRKLANTQNVVCEGRDIGTVVFPDADLKIYMDAELWIRALRRKRELFKFGIDKDLKSIIEDLKIRDEQDKSRKHSPLKVPVDAVVIDTTNLSIKEEVEKVIEMIKERNLG
ncbi:MAG: (d)CMP kinase [bacterium]|nr:(d)CMP kinase [bacterium]